MLLLLGLCGVMTFDLLSGKARGGRPPEGDPFEPAPGTVRAGLTPYDREPRLAIAFTEEKHDYVWTDKFKEWTWLAGRDLIVFDQRGIGGARPALECPEVDATRSAPLDDDKFIAATRACRERLAQSHDLSGYDTAATVLDLAALRQAMKIERWTLWGQSYGSRVALAAMRSRPEGIRVPWTAPAAPPSDATHARTLRSM